jgi:uncharacterized protein (DUF433 family)
LEKIVEQAVTREPETALTEHPHIVRTAGVCGGRPHIRGSRVSVRAIAELFRGGESPQAIAEGYPHLALAAIFDAISYYLDHREEIEAEMAANQLEAVLAHNEAALAADGTIRFRSRS